MRFAERMVLSPRAVAACRGDAKSLHNAKGVFGPSQSGVKSVLDLQRSHGNAFVQRLVQRKLATGTKIASGQELWQFARRHYADAEGKSNLESLFQRNPIGTEDEAMGTYVARPGDSLSLIAGYPNGGWQERLDQLIAANHDHPNIKNRAPDDPQYGWLEIGDIVHIPWLTSGTPLPSAPAPATPLPPGSTAPALPAVGKSRCSVAITGGTKIGITKQFQLTATGLPGQTRGSYTWSVNNSNLAIVSGSTQPACTLKAGVIDGDTEVTVTYAVGNRICSATKTVEVRKPTDEVSTFVRWKPINFTVGEWRGKLLPADVDFSGITVVEIQVGPSADGCWFPGSTWDQSGLSGGTWQIYDNNEYKGIANNQADADSVGWVPDAVRYYRNAGRVPCEAVIKQAMEVVPHTGPNVRYTTQDLRSGINPQDVYSERDGQRKYRGFIS
jgi:hypothetical protein